jgi:hypothetical protein
MMQPAIDEVVDVVAMRHLLVAAFLVLALARDGCTGHWVGVADGNDVFVIVAFVGVMEMAIVQVIDMTIVLDAGVATMFTVDMLVGVMTFAAHDRSLLGQVKPYLYV